jgi:hypothetical protein
MGSVNYDTPYDIEVDVFAKLYGLSIDQARDSFIWAGLQYGDEGPLVCFLARGYVPGLELLQNLALMMTPGEALPELKQELRFRLVMKARNGTSGPVKSRFNTARRNWQLAFLVRSHMKVHGRGSYDAAIKTVASKRGEKEQTVRDAYDSLARKTRRGNKPAK